MRLICFWCAILAVAKAQGGYYAPQTFRNNVSPSATVFRPIYRPWNAEPRIPNKVPRLYTTQEKYQDPMTVTQVSPSATVFRPIYRPWNAEPQIPNRVPRLYTQEKYQDPMTVTQVSPSATEFRPIYRPWNAVPRIPNRVPRLYTLVDPYHKELFSPAGGLGGAGGAGGMRNDVTPQSSIASSWRPAPAPAPVQEPWREPANFIPPQPTYLPKAEPWRLPYQISKEQQAAIIHHKQALTKEGNFRFEYASDNGLAAGEVIEPDGSRVGAYQYKDPNGQLVKLKYRAGKEGFQILEGSHLPKSPEPLPPPVTDNHYQQAYAEQRRQFELQQQYNQQRPEQQPWRENQGNDEGRQTAAGGQYFVQSWRPQGQEDDGQYRENEVESQNRGPHTFGEGYNFSFQG